ncbi:MAG: TolC family protein, partial [Bacteroidales bacterium]|nr:TolC family protein [Bacteroidales bacterium]
LRQPLFRPDIFFNYRIQKDLSEVVSIDVEIYKRELVKEIKTAYFNYLKTVKALTLLEQTLDVVKENVRVNESLYANDKVTLDVVYRSRAELSKVERQLTEAHDFHERAKSYFNFLLNKPLKSEINVMDDHALQIRNPIPEEEALSTALANREELQQVTKYQNVSANNLRRYQYNKAPTLGLGVDYGIQGENYSLSPESDFLFASVVMQWSIFKGFENRSKIREASISQDILEEKYKEVENQIRLQVTDAWYGEVTARETVKTSLSENESASKAFELISKRYYQGQSSLLEFMDARTDMTTAGLSLIIARYDYEISLAELERIVSTYPIE